MEVTKIIAKWLIVTGIAYGIAALAWNIHPAISVVIVLGHAFWHANFTATPKPIGTHEETDSDSDGYWHSICNRPINPSICDDWSEDSPDRS